MTETNRLVRGVPDDLWWRLKVLAAQRKTSLRELVIAALEEYLRREKQSASITGAHNRRLL